jgi:hypothetical protein
MKSSGLGVECTGGGGLSIRLQVRGRVMSASGYVWICFFVGGKNAGLQCCEGGVRMSHLPSARRTTGGSQQSEANARRVGIIPGRKSCHFVALRDGGAGDRERLCKKVCLVQAGTGVHVRRDGRCAFNAQQTDGRPLLVC